MSQAFNVTVPAAPPVAVFAWPQDDDYLITNTGSETVYLENQENATVIRSTPLAAGASKQWPAGVKCYAVTAANTSTLNVGVIGVVNDPGAIGVATANQLIASGLADEIGERVASEIYVTGVPTVDKPNVLESNAVSGSGFSGTYDVSQYASLILNATGPTGFGAGALEQSMLYQLSWYDDDPATVGVLIKDEYFGANRHHELYLNMPCVGPWVVLSVYPNTVFDSASFRLIASYRDRPRLHHQKNRSTACTGVDYSDTYSQVIAPNVPVGPVTINYTFDWNSAPATLSVLVVGTGAIAGRVELRIVHTDSAGVARRLVSCFVTTRGDEQHIGPIMLPPGNLMWTVASTSAAIEQVRAALTSSYGG